MLVGIGNGVCRGSEETWQVRTLVKTVSNDSDKVSEKFYWIVREDNFSAC